MLKFIKRLFCKHEKTTYAGTYLEDVGNGIKETRHIWQCEKCGKKFY